MQRAILPLLIASLAALLLWQLWPASVPGPEANGAPPPATMPAPADPVTAATATAPAAPATEELPADARVAQPAGSPTTELEVLVRAADGSPRPGTTVIAAPQLIVDPWSDEREATTGGDGIAHFLLPGGTWRCRTPIGGSTLVTFGAGEHARATIELPPGRDAVVRVVDDDGAPVAAAELLAVDKAQAARAHALGRTGADGCCTLRDLHDSIYVAARHDSFAPSPPRLVTVAAAKAGPIEIVLSRPFGRCRCTVVDASGAPVPNATVVLGRDLQQFATGDSRGSAPPMQQGITSANGVVDSLPLPPGPVRALARAQGVGVAGAAGEITPGALTELHLELRPGATVRGTVRTADGAPVAGAFVWNAPLRAFGARLEAADDHGSFTLTELVPGRVAMMAQAPPGRATSAELTLVEGGVVEWNPVVSSTPTGGVAGRVIDERDQPLAGWRVAASQPEDGTALGVETDADGRFAIRGLPRGASVRIEVRRPDAGWTGFAAAVVPSTPVDGKELAIRIATATTAGSLRGEVTGPDGAGIAATVRVQHADHRNVAVYATDAAGRFRIDGVPAGELRVEFEAAQLPRLRLPTVTLLAQQVQDLGKVQLGRGGHVWGRLADRDGRAPPAATLLVLDSSDREAGAAEWSADGYRTPLLPPGDYTLLVQAEGYASGRVAITVAAGEDKQVDLVLQPGVFVRIAVVTREPSQQSATTSILVWNTDGHPVWFAHLPMNGGAAEFRTCLATGDYAVRALGVDGYVADGRLTVAGDTPTVALQLELHPKSEPR